MEQTLAGLLYSSKKVRGEFGDRVHAHHTHPVVRAGNQLVLTFTDPPADPNRRLFAMYRTLDDIAPLETIPTPTPTATLIPPPSPTPRQPTPMPNADSDSSIVRVRQKSSRQGVFRHRICAIRVALVPTLLVLVGTLISSLYKRKA